MFMKIAIKVSEIASLIGMNCFRSRETIIRFVKNRIFQNYAFKFEQILTNSNIEYLVENLKLCKINTDNYKIDMSNKYIYECKNFYVYCLKNEIDISDGIVIDNKTRISDKVKHFIPLIDLVHIQFYLLLTKCRRCLLRETWQDGYTRNTYIKFDQSKLNIYIKLLSDTIDDIE